MISIRKINTIIIVIIVLLLAFHAAANVLLFTGLVGYSPIFKASGRWLFYPLVVHIAISLYLYITDKLKKSRDYKNLTKETTIQIVSGIFIILFAALHILNHSLGTMNPDEFLIHIIVDNLLFISIAAHLYVSIPRLFVSLGFLEGEGDYGTAKKRIGIFILIALLIIFTAQAIFYGGFL